MFSTLVSIEQQRLSTLALLDFQELLSKGAALGPGPDLDPEGKRIARGCVRNAVRFMLANSGVSSRHHRCSLKFCSQEIIAGVETM